MSYFTEELCSGSNRGLPIMTIKMSTGESYPVLLKTHAKVVFWLNGNVMSVNNASRWGQNVIKQLHCVKTNQSVNVGLVMG